MDRHFMRSTAKKRPPLSVTSRYICILVLVVVNINLATSSIFQTNKAVDRSYHRHEDPTLAGVWRKRVVWRPRWVKTWQEKRVYVAVWKHTWGPVELNEWIPIPKPPPGWVKEHDRNSQDWGLKKLTHFHLK